jgi:hypothetical protein
MGAPPRIASSANLNLLRGRPASHAKSDQCKTARRFAAMRGENGCFGRQTSTSGVEFLYIMPFVRGRFCVRSVSRQSPTHSWSDADRNPGAVAVTESRIDHGGKQCPIAVWRKHLTYSICAILTPKDAALAIAHGASHRNQNLTERPVAIQPSFGKEALCRDRVLLSGYSRPSYW